MKLQNQRMNWLVSNRLLVLTSVETNLHQRDVKQLADLFRLETECT